MKRGCVIALTTLATACTEVPRFYSTAQADGRLVFDDRFEGERLGQAWNPTGGDIEVDGGMLKLEHLRNRPLWLSVPLPDNVDIAFDAWARSDEGDIKVELAGDGRSVATSDNYVATGYVVIFGGWNNRLNAIARQDEHGRDRKTTTEPRVEPHHRHHIELTRRTDDKGTELTWSIDGREIMVYVDRKPLRGPGHEHFAFSGWEAPVQFDNLRIEAAP